MVAIGMIQVAQMLERFRLTEYIAKFEELGYDDMEWLLSMSAAHVEQLIDGVGMKPGHAYKFKHYLVAERQTQIPAASGQ